MTLLDALQQSFEFAQETSGLAQWGFRARIVRFLAHERGKVSSRYLIEGVQWPDRAAASAQKAWLHEGHVSGSAASRKQNSRCKAVKCGMWRPCTHKRRSRRCFRIRSLDDSLRKQLPGLFCGHVLVSCTAVFGALHWPRQVQARAGVSQLLTADTIPGPCTGHQTTRLHRKLRQCHTCSPCSLHRRCKPIPGRKQSLPPKRWSVASACLSSCKCSSTNSDRTRERLTRMSAS